MRDNRSMSSTPPERAVETATSADATVRRAPKIQNFLLIGAVLGLVVAMALTFIFQRSPEDIDTSAGEIYYSPGQVFGFLLLICVPVGLALAGIVAWLVDRSTHKRARIVRMDKVDVRADQPQVEQQPSSPTAQQEDTNS